MCVLHCFGSPAFVAVENQSYPLSNMSGSKKPRAVANPLESTITTPSERILKECHSLYIDNENGK